MNPNISRHGSAKSLRKYYEHDEPFFEQFTSNVVRLIEMLVPKSSIYAIESRVKGYDSAGGKIQRKEYTNSSDMIDMCGVRIITYLLRDVEHVTRLIDAEFDVSSQHSSDKAKDIAVDRVGYLSVHKVAKISSYRAAETEWARFREVYVEIQIRTILQHAWAAFSHRLLYKPRAKLSERHQRRIYRLAGLLEIADTEFESIWDQTEAAQTVGSYQQRLSLCPAPITKNTLSAYVELSTTVSSIDKNIAKSAKLPLVASDSFIETFLRRLELLNCETIGMIEKLLKAEARAVAAFGIEWFKSKENRGAQIVPKGLAVSFLCFHLKLKEGEQQFEFFS